MAKKGKDKRKSESEATLKTKTSKKKARCADASKRVFVANVPVANLKLIKGFNPRKDLGELADLEAQIRISSAVKDPLEVRPIKEGQGFTADDKYQIIDGHRRFECAKKLGVAHVNVFVSPEYLDDNLALAEAIIKNDSDTDHPLHIVDQAEAVGKLKADTGMTQSKIAGMLGFDENKISRLVHIAGLPESVKADCKAGILPVTSVLAIAKLKEPVKDRLIPQVMNEFEKAGKAPSAERINEMAREIATDANLDDARKQPRKSRGGDAHGGTAAPDVGPKPRSKKELRDMAYMLIALIDSLEAKNQGLPEAQQEDVDIWKAALAGVMFGMSLMDKIELTGKKFSAAFKKLHAEYNDFQSAAAERDAKEKEKDEKKKEKKEKKKDKVKKEKGKKGKKEKKGKGKKGKKGKK